MSRWGEPVRDNLDPETREDPMSTLLVADAVVRMPKTLPRGTTVAQARAALADDHVHLLLITDGGRLLGTLVRDDLDGAASPQAPALPYAVLAGRTISSHAPAEQARQQMLERGQRRLAVLADDGSLLGLLCLKRRRTGFCSDADVAARAADRG